MMEGVKVEHWEITGFKAKTTKKGRPSGGGDAHGRTSLVAAAIAVIVAGCCSFAPCHRGTRIVGAVKDPSGQPIQNAEVKLFGVAVPVDRHGCFKVTMADAHPFSITATAPGYRPYNGEVEYGLFKALIILSPNTSSFPDKIFWTRISESTFASAACP
jgi:hypothetical protein